MKDYESLMGQKFVVERSLEAISETLTKPAPGEEEENQQDADVVNPDDTSKGDDIGAPDGVGRNTPRDEGA